MTETLDYYNLNVSLDVGMEDYYRIKDSKGGEADG